MDDDFSDLFEGNEYINLGQKRERIFSFSHEDLELFFNDPINPENSGPKQEKNNNVDLKIKETENNNDSNELKQENNEKTLNLNKQNLNNIN